MREDELLLRGADDFQTEELPRRSSGIHGENAALAVRRQVGLVSRDGHGDGAAGAPGAGEVIDGLAADDDGGVIGADDGGD